MNSWKSIWNDRSADDFSPDGKTPEEVFMRLKHAMGISRIGKTGEITYKDFFDQFMKNYNGLIASPNGNFRPKSFFDVGCGTGGYLYLLSRIDGEYVLGGVDYSEPFVRIAARVLPGLREMSCGEANQIDASAQYDCVYSRSIFQYFPDRTYARTVVDKMLRKARHSVGIFDVHDLSKRDDFIAYRRQSIPDYEKKYDDNSHLFYAKEFFEDIAGESGCEIKFSAAALPNYWNAAFTYDVYFYKKNQ